MAKKADVQATKVLCKDCFWGGDKIENYLIDCSNTQANPGGYKMGTWARPCRHYKSK